MHKHLFKFIIIGDSGIGKSCLISRFTNNSFIEEHDMTIGVEFGSKVVDINDCKIKIQLWDTAGQECFRSITRSYYKDSIGVVLCYDTTNITSFYNIVKWMDEIKKECCNNVVIMLVGTKNDLTTKRQVAYKEARIFADKHNMLFCETSAKNNFHITECFNNLLDKVYINMADTNVTEKYAKIIDSDAIIKPANCCIIL